MNERPDWDLYFMQFAVWAASRSTCSRLQVGAIVVVKNRLRGSGYNGAPSKQAHCCHPYGDENPCLNSIHAEENAIKFASRTRGGTLYTTHAPCENCAAHIKIAEIERVVYREKYRNPQGIRKLQILGVEVLRLA